MPQPHSPNSMVKELRVAVTKSVADGGAAARGRGIGFPEKAKAFPQCRQRSCGEIVAASIALADFSNLQSLPAPQAAEP
jgi:hypothetical protein